LRKYVNIYLPDCPFEVGTTNRYTVMTAEAAIISRRHIRKGEQIKYLSGIQVEMTEKEEKELSSRTDFSIVLSSRRKRPSLFLGPARFANHDCDSNARLNTSGPHGIHIVACKEIKPGDEITVTYGDDYFGEDNCECLCNTCEELQRNGWDPKGPLLKDDGSDEEDDENEEATPKQPAQSSVPGKRKREHEGPLIVNEAGVEVPAPKRRGRPPKRPRTEYVAEPATPQFETQLSAEEVKGSNEKQRNGRGRFTSRKAVSQPAKVESCEVKRSRSWFPFSREGSREPPQDDLLEKIKRMLGSVSDRLCVQRSSSPEKAVTPEIVKTEIGADEEEEEADEGRVVNSMDVSEWPRNNRGRFTRRSLPNRDSVPHSNPTYARALSRSPERTPTYLEPQLRSAVASGFGSARSRIPSIKKERSFSSLRHVTNADEARSDVYSVPDSPAPAQPFKHRRLAEVVRPDAYEPPADPPAPFAPPAEPPKRKRGRPRKYPRPEEPAVSVTDSSNESTSPSSHGTDSSSSGSLASSATSVSVFTAGNIAQDICTMLVEDEERSVRPNASLKKRKADAEVKEEESEPLTPRRGRSALRRSVRQAPADRSAPPVRSIEVEEIKDEDEEDSDEKRGPVRTPGDYHLCHALLATPYHRWVECRNCDEHFVQSEAFLTRIACPRCERHSKLYGYYWPKTDKDGKHDTEERVLDHRTIHRFIEPEEERSERKGRKTLADLRREAELREASQRQESEESERAIDRRLRISPRRSESRRKLRKTM